MSAFPHRSHSSRRIGGPRVAVILLLVAIVPLAGVGWVSWRAVREARDVEASAAVTEQYAEAAADLARLDGAMFDEMVWRAIGALVSSLEAPPDVVAAFLGADPVERSIAPRRPPTRRSLPPVPPRWPPRSPV